MKTISIKELHAATGRWVRAAAREAVVVTDRGERIATLQPHVPEQPGPVFTREARGARPKVAVDSTIEISADRDRR